MSGFHYFLRGLPVPCLDKIASTPPFLFVKRTHFLYRTESHNNIKVMKARRSYQ